TLMMLAGFETPTEGEILLEGKPLSKLPPYRRSIGMVFQNYALFPHMTVAQNIGFPLSVRGIGAAEIDKRVERALDMVQLPSLGARKTAQLSGGQQPRIARGAPRGRAGGRAAAAHRGGARAGVRAEAGAD